MLNFKELITFEYENEYESAYDLSVKRNLPIVYFKLSIPYWYAEKVS
ncbi:hypothetical protein [Maribacter luteus]|uniref:Uncharacterized protein n=1 Tax=Maribacter luteus TaxID=2594478 RepID=A0A6I2MIE9_9FLAO|nr:hypothetical protein [Maribacter luteus]MRX62607.1 hypothetical protein [Maribacter luteus]